uniref:S1 motif domain-containing protein n=1 Tax=Setaria italica TaxID=4555 RepID=K3Z5W5_SETIT
MPPPSLLSLLPAASISPRVRRRQGKHHKAPTASSHLLCFRRAAAPSPLHVHGSSSSSADGGRGDELHLLEKPSPSVAEDAEEEEPEPVPVLSTEEALAPFLKFFQVKSTDPDAEADAAAGERAESDAAGEAARSVGLSAGGRVVRYYDPKPGDFVAGVVVRSDGRTLDVDIGAGGEPALMLNKEAVPMPGEEFGYLACDVGSERAAEFATEGRVGVMVRQIGGGEEDGVLTSGRNVKEKGAAIKQLNVPIKVKIYEWNAGGLLSRIEGLRAFLPKPEMMTRPRNFTDLKNKVGQEIHVCITRIDEGANELIISEKEAWAVTYLREGTLLQGTVRKLFPYGAQIRIGETNRGGLLHMSNITHGQLRSVADVLRVGETVKALVIKSTTPDRIALSTKDLESEPGLFITDKEKVFSEAEEMGQRYREQIAEPPRSGKAQDPCNDAVPFDNEAQSYANWKWLRFSKPDEAVNRKSRSEF